MTDIFERRVKRHEHGIGRAKVQVFPEDEENDAELVLFVKNGRSLKGSKISPDEAREIADSLHEAADFAENGDTDGD